MAALGGQAADFCAIHRLTESHIKAGLLSILKQRKQRALTEVHCNCDHV